MQLVAVVDRVPETRGFGVCYRKGGQFVRLRAQPAGGATVIFERHERQISSAWLQQMEERRGPYAQNPRFSDTGKSGAGWSVRKPVHSAAPGWSVHGNGAPFVPATALTPRAGVSIPARGAGTSVAAEWRALGFNCIGAGLAWVRIAGAGALAPITGGTTGIGAILLYGGAIASSGQCVASVYRVHNATHGRASVNAALDANQYYKWTMRGADALSLAGAGSALTQAAIAGRALKVAGTSWSAALQRTTTVTQRASAAAGFGIQSARVGSKVMSRIARQMLLDRAAGVLGIAGSYDNGLINELIVWIAEEEK